MTFEQIMQKEGFTPNIEQKKVIESDRNTVVAAGAGAGKTAVLSWRFLRLVMEKGIKPEQILTLTFTKKAASEMRERIYKRLLQAKDSISDDALQSFSHADIATLDSFCAQIVRTDCTSYGLPRDITNLSDNDLDNLCNNLALEFINDPENSKEVDVLSSIFMPNHIISKFFSVIAYKVSIAKNYDSNEVWDFFFDFMENLYNEKYNALCDLYEELGSCYLSEKVGAQYEKSLINLEAETLTEDDKFNLKGVKDEEVKELINEIREIQTSGYIALQNMIKSGKNVPVLQEAVEKFALMLIKSKREGGLLSFNDVSDLAVNILRDNKTIREYYKNKYCYIMIDEFQDNNSKQRDLLFLLAEKKDICNTGRIPTIDELEEEKLFFVGDDKQSIYRFRGADVSVFRRLQEEIAVNGNALTLRKNYRSQSKLINHFNDVFSTVFTTSSTGADYEAQYNPIETGRKEDNTQSKIVFAVYDKDEIKKEEDDIGAFEAELVGSYCDRVLNTDEFLVNGKRPNPEDIAILFKSSSNQMNIEKALKKRGINYQIAETRSLMLDAVSNDFYCFINYLLYPNDKRSYYSLLKSPFCGLCEQSIINLNQGLDVLEVDQNRYKAFSLFFEQVKNQAFRLTIPQLLEMLYIQGGYKAYLDSSSDNQSFIEHYDYLYSYAIQYQEEGRGLGDFARFIRSYLGDNQKLPDVSVLHSEKSGVQIMSVHKSKGLEFKVVIYTGIGSNGKRDIKDCVFDYNDSIIATEETSIQDLLDEDKKAKETAELKRVMYVAFTRAMDHLITIGGYNLTKEKEYNKKDTNDVLIWYCKAIGYDNENHIATNKAVTVDYIIQAPTTKSKKSNREEKALQESLSSFVSSPNRVSVTALKAKEEHCVSNIVSLPNYPIDDLLIENNLQDKFGTLCHFALESLLKNGTYDDVKCTIFESDKANNLALNQAKAFADSFVNSDFYKQNIAEKESLQELRFYTSDKQNNGLAIEGVIDLLVFGDDYNLVVDYKTDSYKNPEEHKIQVLTYIKAVQEIYNKKCYGTLFYLRDASTSPIWEEDGNEIRKKVAIQ